MPATPGTRELEIHFFREEGILWRVCSRDSWFVSQNPRVHKKWFRYFNDHKDFYNEGSLHLSVSWPYIRMPAFVQTIGKSACSDIWKAWAMDLQIIRTAAHPCVHSKAGARELMNYFQDADSLSMKFWMKRLKCCAIPLVIEKTLCHLGL